MPPRWRRQLKHLRCASGIVLSPVEVDVRDVQGLVEVGVKVFVAAIVLAVVLAVVLAIVLAVVLAIVFSIVLAIVLAVVLAVVLSFVLAVVICNETIWLDSSFNSLNEAVLCMTQPLT